MTTRSTFLDVEVAGIQAYLGRSRRLRGRRGASALLIDLHTRPPVRALLGGSDWRPNDAAPRIDGKLSLVAGADSDPAAFAGRLVGALREAVPAAELRAHWFTSSDYLAERPDPDQPHSDGAGHLVSLAPRPEWPLARPCDRCGIDPATATVEQPEPERLCRDCAARDALGREASPHERALARQLEDATGTGGTIIDDFHQLAALGPGTHKRNHLATVFLDANRLGAVVSRLAADDPHAIPRLSQAVTAAVDTALTAAAIAVHERAGSPARTTTVPHVKGGDDVLVTVPAALWSPFVLTYLDEFDSAVTDAGFPDITTSVAVVIAHQNHPFHDLVDVAAELLRRAKDAHAGEEAAVAWVDLTDERIGANAPVSHRWLLERRWALDALAEADQSARSRLAVAARQGPVALGRQYDRAPTPGADPFTGDADPVASTLAALSLARWWTP